MQAKQEPEQPAIDAEHRPLVIKEEAQLAPRGGLFSHLSPREKLDRMREVADVLREMLEAGKIKIDAKGKKKRIPLITRIPEKNAAKEIIGYSEHTNIEGWLACAILSNAACRIIKGSVQYLAEAKGYKAEAEVIDLATGVVLGSAEGQCDASETKWRFKPLHQMKSMCQTRARSLALSSVFRGVMAMAGYSGTPTEEMDASEKVMVFEADDREPPPMPKAPPQKSQRNKDLASVHIGKVECGLSEAAYISFIDFNFPGIFDDANPPSCDGLSDSQVSKLAELLRDLYRSQKAAQ